MPPLPTLSAAISAFRAGDFGQARGLLDRLVAAGSASSDTWLMLATACDALDDATAAERAVDKVLAGDARNVRALVLKGDCRRKLGDQQGGTRFYAHAVALAEGRQHPPVVASAVARAVAMLAEDSAQYRAHMEQWLTGQGAARSPRFQQSLDILYGEKQPYFQQPTAFFFPELAQRQFFERSEFPWVAGVEAATDAIRAELAALLVTEEGFRPYLVNAPDRPRGDFHGLHDNPQWSTLYLIDNGRPMPDVIARAPKTYAAISALPLCAIGNRAPTVMFSLLRAGARIPPHTGMLNTRIICHLPLMVPPDCGFRVGNEVRMWEVGKTLIFDDTIEHEAWNNSDEDRVVLIFDVWRPELSVAERAALVTMFAGIDGYGKPVAAS